MGKALLKNAPNRCPTCGANRSYSGQRNKLLLSFLLATEHGFWEGQYKDLAKILGTSRATIRRATRDLKAESLVYVVEQNRFRHTIGLTPLAKAQLATFA